jgi:hypothetical protein
MSPGKPHASEIGNVMPDEQKQLSTMDYRLVGFSSDWG